MTLYKLIKFYLTIKIYYKNLDPFEETILLINDWFKINENGRNNLTI